VKLSISQNQESQAIILRAQPLPRNALLLHAFCRSQGLVKISLNPGLQKQAGPSCSAPLSEVFLRFRETRSSIYKAEDISAIDYHLENRKNFNCLQESLKLLQITETLYLPGAAAQTAFDLLSFYLRCIPKCQSPAILRLSYSLKLLILEGMLYFPQRLKEQKNFAPYYSVEMGEFTPMEKLSSTSFTLSAEQARYFLFLAEVQRKKDLLFLEENKFLIDLGTRLVQTTLNS